MIKTICLIIIISSGTILPQNYFPMKLGNKYQIEQYYEGHVMGGGYYYGTLYRKFFPVQETLINNKFFFRFADCGVSGYPFRTNCFYGYDTLEKILYVKISGDDTLRTAIDFNIPKDSSFVSYLSGSPTLFVSYGLSYQTIKESDPVLTFGMRSYDYLPYLKYYFVSGRGLSAFSYAWLDDYYTECSVISSIIDTLIFNRINLSITSLTPIINRPLDAFPFVIHADYATNIDITDTFKLICKYQRDTQVYYTRTDIFNTHHDINIMLPNGVLPGDILKVRAEITDSSIFNNFASFPDTGYASILILGPVGITDKNIILSYRLEQNYPDPFNPSTTIKYGIKERTHVKLSVHDFLGREVKVLLNESKEPGDYQVRFDGSGLSSGVYIYTLLTKNFVKSNKMILLK